MKNLFGAGATAFLTCLDMAVKSEVEKWPDEEEKPFADSKKIVLRKVHNKGMCMSLLKEYPQFVKYTSLVMAAILTVWDILCLRKKGSYLKKAGLSLGVAGAWSNTLDRWMRGYVVKEKRTTKIDIAQKLNLSIATVDRVFNNRGSVSPRTRELVLEAARELNYIPNKNAKYLSKKVRCNIGISYLLPEWFGSQVERGIQQAYEEFRDFGMQLIISKDALDEKEQIRKIREMLPEIDALAVAPWEPGTEFSDFINSLIDSGIPVVTFNNDMPLSRRLMYVGSDYVVAGRCK